MSSPRRLESAPADAVPSRHSRAPEPRLGFAEQNGETNPFWPPTRTKGSPSHPRKWVRSRRRSTRKRPGGPLYRRQPPARPYIHGTNPTTVPNTRRPPVLPNEPNSISARCRGRNLAHRPMQADSSRYGLSSNTVPMIALLLSSRHGYGKRRVVHPGSIDLRIAGDIRR